MPNRALRVLAIEDSSQDALKLYSELEKGGYRVELKRICSLPELESALEDNWHLITSEYLLNGFSAMDALALCRVKSGIPPFILVSKIGTEESIVSSIRAGATDYVIKTKLERFLPAVERALNQHARPTDSPSRRAKHAIGGSDLTSLLQDTIETIKPMMPNHADIILKNNGNPGTIHMDPEQLRKIIKKLCLNFKTPKSRHCISIEANPVIRKKSTCHTCHKVFQGNFLMISVSDNCQGMFSGNNTLSGLHRDRQPDTGAEDPTHVGALVHRHGGHLIYEINRESASSCHVLLPTPDPQRPRHILIVDDDRAATLFMSSVFKTKGFKVTSLCNSKAALQRFKNDAHRYDLAFVDLYMPELNGTQLAAALLEIKPDLAVVLCTGERVNLDEAKTKSMGIAAIIYKPMRIKQILDVADELLISKPSPPDLTTQAG